MTSIHVSDLYGTVFLLHGNIVYNYRYMEHLFVEIFSVGFA